MPSADDRMETLAPVGREPGQRRARRAVVGAKLRQSPPEMRPLDVGQIVDLATRVLLSRFLLLPAVAFLLWLPSSWLQAELMAALESGEDPVFAYSLLGISLGVQALVVKLTAGVAVVLTFPWMWGFAGKRPALRLLPALPGLLLVSALYGAAIASGLVTCFLTSVLFGWKLLLAPLVVVAESPNPLRAVARSWQLTRGGFLRWVGVWVVASMLTMPFSAAANEVAAGSLHEWLTEQLAGFPAALIDGSVTVLTGALLALPIAFSAAAVVVFYSDLLVRREGLDLTLRLSALRAREAGAAAGGPPAPEAGGLT